MENKSENSSRSRKIIITLSILVVVVAACSGFYYFARVKPYRDLISSADKAVAADDFDKAVSLYAQGQTYKKDSEIDKKIKLIGILKSSKINYDEAEVEMKDKDYLAAIDIFKKVDSRDTKRYSDSKNKITQCKSLYVADNLSKAKANLKNNNFDDANKYLANVSKIDSGNKDVKSIKEDIAKAVQEQKKKQEEAAAAAQDNSSSVPSANGAVTFDQALAMVVKAEFPDGKYAVINNNDGSKGYVSLDSTAVVKNKVTCEADIHGRGIGYDSTEAQDTDIYLNGNTNIKKCYSFNLSEGGHIPGGYYVEADTGKMYKHNMGNSHAIN